MTDENQIEDQDVELYDDENEIMEAQGHDPKNAEVQSVASVDKAGDATGTAAKRKGDSGKQDPMPKMPGTKAGMINAMYLKASKMKKEDLAAMYGKIMAEDFDTEDGVVFENDISINYQADFSDDLNAIMANEATLSEEFKEKTAIIFEAAIKSKLAEEIDRLEEKYNEELEAEITSTKEDLVEKVDSYLNYVVENWMEENKVAIQTGLRTEIAEDFMNKMKDLFTESYIDVPESKIDLVDELAETVEELEEKLNAQTGKAIEMAEELESYKRDAIIREASRDLVETQVEKLKSLVDDIDFDDEETFAKKVATVKESYFNKVTSTESADFDTDEGDDDIVEASGSMAQYLIALKRTQ
jgi:hypothetical protein